MFRALAWLAVLGAVVYIGARYAGPHYRAWRFHDAMIQAARVAEAREGSEIRASLLEVAEELGIPLGPGGLRIRRAPLGRATLAAAWEEVVVLDGGPLGAWTDTLRFRYEVEL